MPLAYSSTSKIRQKTFNNYVVVLSNIMLSNLRIIQLLKDSHDLIIGIMLCKVRYLFYLRKTPLADVIIRDVISIVTSRLQQPTLTNVYETLAQIHADTHIPTVHIAGLTCPKTNTEYNSSSTKTLDVVRNITTLCSIGTNIGLFLLIGYMM